MNLIEIRLLHTEELDKINRSEHVEHRYQLIEGELKSFDEPFTVPSGASFWDGFIDDWKRAVARGAAAFGAFDDEVLAGIAILDPNLDAGTEQLLALYVDCNHRMSGIAKSLYIEAQDAAKKRNAKTLYVSATPTDSSVKFYLGQGFEPTTEPHPDLLAQKADDIHMTKSL